MLFPHRQRIWLTRMHTPAHGNEWRNFKPRVARRVAPYLRCKIQNAPHHRQVSVNGIRAQSLVQPSLERLLSRLDASEQNSSAG
jgi:hypothetical protein